MDISLLLLSLSFSLSLARHTYNGALLTQGNPSTPFLLCPNLSLSLAYILAQKNLSLTLWAGHQFDQFRLNSSMSE
jgi:hypothetical protein